LPILCAPGDSLGQLRARAVAKEVDVIDFPTFGQQTNDYDEFRHHVTKTPSARLEYLGLALRGPQRAITKLTGNLRLLR
jgi:hypothetical protein